jgi:hypothetical protein
VLPGDYECDPLSHIEELLFFSSLLFPSGTAVSPEGEAAQGKRPLDPSTFFSFTSVEKPHHFPTNLLSGYRNCAPSPFGGRLFFSKSRLEKNPDDSSTLVAQEGGNTNIQEKFLFQIDLKGLSLKRTYFFSSRTSSAFWAWSRFSASSQTRL